MPHSFRIRLVDAIFIAIGLLIGTILVLQIQADPVRRGRTPMDEMQVRRDLVAAFSVEQESLKQELAQLQEQYEAAQKTLEKNSSQEVKELRARLIAKAGLKEVSGAGVEILLNDNPKALRLNFSGASEDFVQASDLRDLVNWLFLQDAEGVAINGIRINPLTPIHSAFDTILIDNRQFASPFLIEAVGNQDALSFAADQMKRRGMQMFVTRKNSIKVAAPVGIRTFKFAALTPQP